MMGNMRGPKQTAIMINPMQPVIHEIFKKKYCDPVNPGIRNRIRDTMIEKESKNYANINSSYQQDPDRS